MSWLSLPFGLFVGSYLRNGALGILVLVCIIAGWCCYFYQLFWGLVVIWSLVLGIVDFRCLDW